MADIERRYPDENAGYEILRYFPTEVSDSTDMGFCLGFKFDSPTSWVTWRYRRFGNKFDFFGGNYFRDILSAQNDLDHRLVMETGCFCDS